MATSGSINFSLNRNEIITDALELIGAIGIGDTPSANDVTSCARTLNMMVKAWNGRGIHLWALTNMSVTLVADTASYVLSPRPLHIKQARFRDSDSVDRPVRIDSSNSYNLIANKTTTGSTVNRVYYDLQLSTGTLYVWPVPDAAIGTIELTYLRSLEDFDASSDDADFPQEWLECLTYNLAVMIAPKYGKVLSKTNPDLLQIAQSALIEMQLWDTESSKVKIVPARDYSA